MAYLSNYDQPIKDDEWLAVLMAVVLEKFGGKVQVGRGTLAAINERMYNVRIYDVEPSHEVAVEVVRKPPGGMPERNRIMGDLIREQIAQMDETIEARSVSETHSDVALLEARSHLYELLWYATGGEEGSPRD